MKTNTTVALATLFLASLAAGSAQAQCEPYHAKIALEPTKESLSLGLGAIATAGLQVAADCNELFGVTVAGKMEDGETLTIVVVSKVGTVQVGTITMFDSIGQLVLDSEHDVSDVFPVSQLASIQVIMGSTNKARKQAATSMTDSLVLFEGAF